MAQVDAHDRVHRHVEQQVAVVTERVVEQHVVVVGQGPRGPGRLARPAPLVVAHGSLELLFDPGLEANPGSRWISFQSAPRLDWARKREASSGVTVT